MCRHRQLIKDLERPSGSELNMAIPVTENACSPIPINCFKLGFPLCCFVTLIGTSVGVEGREENQGERERGSPETCKLF